MEEGGRVRERMEDERMRGRKEQTLLVFSSPLRHSCLSPLPMSVRLSLIHFIDTIPVFSSSSLVPWSNHPQCLYHNPSILPVRFPTHAIANPRFTMPKYPDTHHIQCSARASHETSERNTEEIPSSGKGERCQRGADKYTRVK